MIAKKYSNKTIAMELVATALGNGYYGNSLYVAKDIPGLTNKDCQCIGRWLSGFPNRTDGFDLQDIANRIAAMDEQPIENNWFGQVRHPTDALITNLEGRYAKIAAGRLRSDYDVIVSKNPELSHRLDRLLRTVRSIGHEDGYDDCKEHFNIA